jgi:hypothetical protein
VVLKDREGRTPKDERGFSSAYGLQVEQESARGTALSHAPYSRQSSRMGPQAHRGLALQYRLPAHQLSLAVQLLRRSQQHRPGGSLANAHWQCAEGHLFSHRPAALSAVAQCLIGPLAAYYDGKLVLTY